MRSLTIFFALAYILIAQAPPPQFTVTDLGILPGKAYSQATAISSNGTVVGYSATAGYSLGQSTGAAQGWIFAQGVQTAMNVDGPTIPIGVNASGQVVGITGQTPGFSDGELFYAPFFYLNGTYNTPGNLAIDNVCAACAPDVAVPTGISDTGVVALTSDPEGGFFEGDGGPFLQAGMWAAGSLTALPLPSDCPALKPASGVHIIDDPNFCMTRAMGISANGQFVAGFVWYWNQRVYEPALWTNGQLATFASSGLMAGVNNSGQGVGFAGGGPAMFSQTGTSTSLGTGWFPVSINDPGWIVGSDQPYSVPGGLYPEPVFKSITAGSANAILWAGNTKYNLNSCSCINNSSGWEFDYAYAVNDAGQIVGTGFHNGVETGFLLNPGPVPPAVTAVVNGASFKNGGVVPGEMATLFGTNLTTNTGINVTSGLPLPTSFVTNSVMVNNHAAALFAVDNVNGQQQINFQVPWEVASGPTATIAVANGDTTGASLTVPVLQAQPGIFNYTAGGNTFGAILHANFQLANTANPAKPGETMLIYCTGLGAVASAPADGAAGNGEVTMNNPAVTIGGTKAIVSFSGLAPNFVGLYQVNAEVPATLKAGNQIVTVEVSGASSNSVLLPVS